MFKLKKPVEYYKKCYSEYLTEKYSKNFFKFSIDIGACGINQKWHINHMGKDNPETTFIGFEPEEKGFNLINKECESLENVKLYKQFFGRDISLKKLLKDHDLDPDEKWSVSCDCEGDEKYLFNNPEDLEILKKGTHIAFEIHPRLANIKYIDFLKIFNKEFGETHKIIRTFHGGGGSGVLDNSSFILVKKEVHEGELKEIVEYLKLHPHTKYHYIKEFN